NIFFLRTIRQVGICGLYPGAEIAVFNVKQSVNILNGGNGCIAQASPAQSYAVNAGVTERFAGSFNIRWNVLPNQRSSGDESMLADANKLLDCDYTFNHYKIFDGNMSGNCCGIGKNTSVADCGIVGNVHVSHQQAIGPDRGFGAICSAPVDGYKFTDGGVVTDFGCCYFTGKFQILWYGRNDRSGKY